TGTSPTSTGCCRKKRRSCSRYEPSPCCRPPCQGGSQTMTHPSSTQEVPAHGEVPRHIAIIMDGNGRWAKRQHLPRIAGHRRGVEAVRAAVRACAERGVRFLTLFAFSSENWR